MTVVAAALDIGGTKTAAAVVTADGAVASRCTAPTPAADGPDAVLGAAAALVRRAVGEHRAIGLGVGSAGAVDPASGRVRSATDALPGWAGTDLAGSLGSALGLPVATANDVHAHALGEYWLGAARGAATVLFAAVGTGVGGCLLLDGAVHGGARAAAGHLGHVPVPAAAGVRCPCGASGHVEAVASGPALASAYRERTGRAAGRLQDVVRAERSGDAAASAVLAGGGAALGTALAGAANVVDPDIVVVGGGVAAAGRTWWAALRKGVEQGLIPALRGLPVEPAELGADAALLGAGRMAWRKYGEQGEQGEHT